MLWRSRDRRQCGEYFSTCGLISIREKTGTCSVLFCSDDACIDEELEAQTEGWLLFAVNIDKCALIVMHIVNFQFDKKQSHIRTHR